MNIIKYKQPRYLSRFYGRYILSCWIICASVFGSYLYTLNLIVGASFFYLFLGLIAPLIVGWMVMLSFFSDQGNDRSVIDKSLTTGFNTKELLVNTSLKTKTYYYPAIDKSVDPIFSIQSLLNVTVLSFLIPYSVSFLVVTHDFWLTLAVTGIAIALSWIAFAFVNVPTTYQVLRGNALADPASSFVNMNYSYAQLEKLCDSQQIFFSVEADKKTDLLRLIARKAVVAGQVANDLIAGGYADPNLMTSEIAVIEHIANSFVPTTITTSNDFFEKYKGKKDAAEKIYLEKIAEQIRSEAFSLKDKIEAITLTLKNLSIERERAIQQAEEDSISIDVALIAMTESANLPIPEFPEFHSLKFKNDMNKAAAKNIVMGSLMTLVDAKDKAASVEDKQKLDTEIGNVKTFVKSLASDTPESVAREVRLVEANKADALYLGAEIGSMSDIDNIIAIQQRYIKSYDTTLPSSNQP